MNFYIVKSIICSALLIAIYFLLLEKEKTHTFNRFYLLFGIFFSLLVPAIKITSVIHEPLMFETFSETTVYIQNRVSEQIIPIKESRVSILNILLWIYTVITTILFIRFLVNIFILLIKVKKSRKINYGNTQIVLTNDNLFSHSFLNYIIVPERDYSNGLIQKEVIEHELAHVYQKHSLDILIIEILIVFVWFNPFIFLYKRAMQLNHEFLADQYVVKSFNDKRSYQMLLLNNASHSMRFNVTSHFNYINTKKRLIMMSKKVSYKSAILKQIALIPVMALFAFLFATKIVAQEPKQDAVQIPYSENGASQELIDEYRAIFESRKVTLKNGSIGYNLNFNQEEMNRLEDIFFKMSKEQQDNQIHVLVPLNSMILEKKVPTPEQLESFKDPKMYGVWLDGKRVENSVLNKYVNTDFSQVSVSKLLKTAKNYGKHVYQLNLMTNEGYQNYYNEQKAQKGYMIMTRNKFITIDQEIK